MKKAYIQPEFDVLKLASAEEILNSFEQGVDENNDGGVTEGGKQDYGNEWE